MSESIPINRIISKLDDALSHNNNKEAERLLLYWQKEAESLKDTRGLISIINEQIGFYRRFADKEKAMNAVQRAMKLVQENGLFNDTSGATVYLNCATTMKAFGRAAEAVPIYEIVKSVYEKNYSPTDYNLAGLYNNYATTLTELKQYDKAEEMYCKAAEILIKRNDHRGELAVTYVNIAHLIADRDIEDEKASDYMQLAWSVLDSNLPLDGYYAFIAEKCAPSFGYFGFYFEQKELEKRAKEIYERN